MRNLTLVIPGLLTSMEVPTIDPVTRLPAVELLLAKGNKKKTGDIAYCTSLCGLFGLEKTTNRDLPIAALSRLLDAEDRPEGIWMRADPVHFSTGRDGLMLMDATNFSLTQREAIILGASLKALFAEEGWEVEVPFPTRWYIKLNTIPDIETVEINQVRGNDVQAHMPVGPEKNKWNRLLTEVQMLLHGSEINQEREQSGELPINSLWFWGIGELPDSLSRHWSVLYADDVVAQGLATISATPYFQLPETVESVLTASIIHSDILIVNTTMQALGCYDNYPAWQECLTEMEQNWFEPLLNALRKEIIDSLVIVTDGHTFTINKYALLKFWSRRRPVTHYL